jgi:hypothetical protein
MHSLIYFLYYIGMGSDDFPLPLVATTFQLLLFSGIGSDDFPMPLIVMTFQLIINPFISHNSKICKTV